MIQRKRDAGRTVVAPDLRCDRCGYNLRGLSVPARCPECGEAIALTMRRQARRRERFGPPLADQGARWLALTGSGFCVYVAGALLRALLPSYGWRNADGRFAAGSWFCYLVSDVILWLGVWLWTRRADGEKRHATATRRILRGIVTVWLVANGSFLVQQLTDPGAGSPQLVAYATLWSAAVGSVVGFAYLAHLAARLGARLLPLNCALMSAVAVTMIVAVVQKMSGTYRPEVGGITLLWPLQPLLGNVEEATYYPYCVRQWLGGMTFSGSAGKYAAGMVWLAWTFATLSGFAVTLFALASKVRSRAGV